MEPRRSTPSLLRQGISPATIHARLRVLRALSRRCDQDVLKHAIQVLPRPLPPPRPSAVHCFYGALTDQCHEATALGFILHLLSLSDSNHVRVDEQTPVIREGGASASRSRRSRAISAARPKRWNVRSPPGELGSCLRTSALAPLFHGENRKMTVRM
jgi:hypothetical protein